jgi:flagellar biosynthesis chaperone FliJ
MKKFAFPLERVMDFRRMQARLEEIKIEALYAELRAIDTREVALIAQKAQSEKALRTEKSVTGFDLELFATFREAMTEELKRMDKARIDCRKRIDAQLALLTVKRREVRLLEKLKDQRFEKWEKEMFKEIDQQAEEAYLAKLNRHA